MAYTFVSSTEAQVLGTTNPRTMTFDIGTRTNGLLVVGVQILETVDRAVTAATWNSVALASAVSRIDTLEAHVRNQLLYLTNPTNGNQTLSITLDGVTAATLTWIWAAWYDGADQTQASILDQTGSNTGATDPNVGVTPGQNDELIVSNYYTDGANTLTAAGSPTTQTGIQNNDYGPRAAGSGYVIQVTAGLQTMDWSGADANWSEVVASFKPFIASGTTWPGYQSPFGWR